MKKFLSHVLTLVILLTMVMTPKAALAADSTAYIGDNYIDSYDDLAGWSHIATVTKESGTNNITITLKKDIIGRIEFAIPDAHIIFNAAGHTVDGGTENQCICLVHNTKVTVELTGNGTYKKGKDSTIYVGNGNTLVINKGIVIEGDVVNAGTGIINDLRQHNHTWATTWTKDDDGHWYACSGCDDMQDYSKHSDMDKDHICDSGCGKTDMGTHADLNKDHECDYGCSVTIGTHAQATDKHTCDYCGVKMSDCSGGTATCTKKAICSVCGAEYGELLQHTYGTDWKSDKHSHWHECTCGDKKDTAAHTPKTVNGKEATTTEKGYTGDTVCGICGYEIAKGEDIPAKVTPTEPDDNKPTSPETGDSSNMVLWFGLLILSALCLVGASVIGKKSKVNQ